MKTKPQRAKPVSQNPAPANVPDLEDLVMTRMKSMRDAKELAKMENIQALIAQSRCSYLYIYISIGNHNKCKLSKAIKKNAAAPIKPS